MKLAMLYFAALIVIATCNQTHSQTNRTAVELAKLADTSDIRQAGLKLIDEAERYALSLKSGCTQPSETFLNLAFEKLSKLGFDALELGNQNRTAASQNDPLATALLGIATSRIRAISEIDTSTSVDIGEAALQSGCLDIADEYFRRVAGKRSAGLESYIRRAQIGIEDVRDRRRSKK